jgi:hypothetical protein
MQPCTRTQIYFRPLAGTTRLLCLLTAFLIVSCLPTLAQNAPEQKPTYLSTLETLVRPGYYGTGAATFLGKSYTNSVHWLIDGTIRDARYQVPVGYTRFQATVGVNNTETQTNMRCTFTVIGIDGNAQMHTLDTVQALPLQNGKEINVSLDNIKILILSQKTDGAIANTAWWGDAQFTNIGSTPPPPPPGTKMLLVYNEDSLQEQMQSLAQKIKKALDPDEKADRKSISLCIAPLMLKSVSDEPLADKNSEDMQQSLREELNRAKIFDLSVSKEPLGGSLTEGWQIGDDLDEKMRAALRKNIEDARYALLGRLKDNKDQMQAELTVDVYDLRTGKCRTEENLKARIAVKERRKENGIVGPTPKIPITLVFSPDDSLRVRSYHWSVDGEDEGEMQVSGTNSQPVAVDATLKKHKVSLTWSGDGCTFKSGIFTTNKVSYKKVTLNFEIDTSKPENVELTAKVDMVLQKLNMMVQVGDNKFTVKWP